jgi:phosphodiesterase/alkaline phosphatase D-like protein
MPQTHQGDKVRTTEHTAKIRSPRTGIFATLRALLPVPFRVRAQGTGAPSRLALAFALSLSALALTAAPALAAAPEEPETLKPSEPVKATEATFHGFLNPKAPGALGTYEFLYKAGTECEGGSKAPASPAIDLGGVEEPVSQPVTSLTPGTEYTVCLLARNGTEKNPANEIVGPSVTFTTATPAEAPETKPATGETATTATLHGVLNPIAEAEAGWYFAFSTGAKCTSGGPGGGETAHEVPAKVKALAVEKEVTGLEPNMPYKFCLLATNTAEDPTPGNEVPLKTSPLPPTIASATASAVKSTEATLEAQINPNNEKTKYTFEYSTQEKSGVLEGTIVKVPGAAELEGFPEKLASVALTGLEAGETYFYRVVAENEQSEKEGKPVVFPVGSVQSFTTVPTPSTDAVAALTATTVTFNGHLTPLNEKVATQYHFDYNLGLTCTGLGETPAVEAGTGKGTEVKATANVTGLQPNAEYTVCLVTSNASGSAEGPAVHFTTPAVPPKIDSETVSGVTPTEATLEAQVNPNNQKTTYSFEYATNPGLAGATTIPGAALEGFGDKTASVSTGALLKVGETYYYRVLVENTTSKEVLKGTIESFTPQGAPLVTTAEASGVTRTTALLSGTVNPAGAATTYHFAYIEQPAYETAVAEKAANPYAKGRTTSESASVGSDYTAHAVGPLLLTELHPSTTYHYALVATSSLGTTVDPMGAMFTTSAPTPPVALTGEAVGVTQLSATLTGSVNTQGLQTTLQFEFGTTPYAGSLQPATVTSSSGTVLGISTSFNGDLQPGTTYYYRVVASSKDGTSSGAEKSFTTGSFPGLPGAAPVQLIAWPPFVAAALAASEPHETTNTGGPKPLTKAQKLAKALKACSKKPKKQRASCRRQAKRRYR